MALTDIFLSNDVMAMTDDQVMTWLQESIVVSQDDQFYHWDGVAAKLSDMLMAGAFVATSPPLSPTDVATFVDILSSMPLGFQTLNSLFTGGPGCQISLPTFQATVAAMEIAEPPKAVVILNAILSIGQPQTKARWEVIPLPSLPQKTDVTSARAQYLVNQKVTFFFNHVFQPYFNSGVATVQGVKDLVNNDANWTS